MAQATSAVSSETKTVPIEKMVEDVLLTIDKEREREIIARRFGLFDRRETLEQIGELLGITRERVRQLEKAMITRLKSQGDKELPHIKEYETYVLGELRSMGNVARVINLTARLTKTNTKIDQSRVAFLAKLSPRLTVIDDNDHYHHSVAITAAHSESAIKDMVEKIIAAIKAIGKPIEADAIVKHLKHDNKLAIEALASTSKHLATLNKRWGLIKWPMVNPKNIRDKIYLILHENGKHMHFSEIAAAIKESAFKRKDVTVQAIHNELIKDKRFVLVGRGIYALEEWGYQKGTVADIITSVLKAAGEPLHRDEIVKRVLESRYVKETTILLNLQAKPQFKRVSKATFALAE